MTEILEKSSPGIDIMLQDFISQLQQIVGAADLSQDAAVLRSHCRDYKGYNEGTALAVVFPRNTEAVVDIVRLCKSTGVKIVPQGGNTSTYGGAVPDKSGKSIVVSLARMNAVIDIDTTNNTATVEAGVVLGELNRQLASHQRWFPMSFGSEDSCRIGGNIAMNSGGNTVMRYGMVRENVMGIEAVLGDGTVFSNLKSLRKKCIGYDIGQLLIGSEGTLGIITRAVLKLQPLMTSVVTAWLSCDSLESALRTLETLQRAAGDRLICFEVMSRLQREIIIEYQPSLKEPIAGAHEWAILAEFADTAAEDSLRALAEGALGTALEEGSITDAVIAANETQRKTFWRFREYVLDANKAYGWPVTHDASVPVSQLPTFAKRVEDEVRQVYPASRFVAAGHAGDGNIHLGVIFDRSAFGGMDEFKENARRINHMVFEIAHQLGGHFASEHGIGVLHLDAFQHFMAKDAIRLMASLKALLDPAGIMNPGKIFRAARPNGG
jgi:FAD/FMN-containing dehydrogenase